MKEYMERTSFPDRQQMTATLLRFVFFLGGMVNEPQWHFEQEMEGCHPEDVRVLFLWMEPRGPLMVKEIAQELKDVSLSTLTRMLDRLELQGYVRRMLNPQDRRSFRVMPTERGQQGVERFLQHWTAQQSPMIASMRKGIINSLVGEGIFFCLESIFK